MIAREYGAMSVHCLQGVECKRGGALGNQLQASRKGLSSLARLSILVLIGLGISAWVAFKLTQPCRAQELPDCPACSPLGWAGEEEGPAVVSSRNVKGAAGPFIPRARVSKHCRRLTSYQIR